MPAPKMPLPIMPSTSTIVTTSNALAPCFAHENPAEKEKENEREEVIEKQDRPIPARQFQIDLEQGEKCFHFIPVISSLSMSTPILPRSGRNFSGRRHSSTGVSASGTSFGDLSALKPNENT